MSRAIKTASYALLLLASSCSFIDDFDSFEARDRAPDSATANDMDGGSDGQDGGHRDGGPLDGNVEDGGGETGRADAAAQGDVLCAGKDDGVVCGPQNTLICLRGFCRTSRCGDGFVHGDMSEQCDDANLTSGDGCEPTCVYTCEKAADCDNGQVCDGEEQCDVSSHRCVKDPLPSTNKSCKRTPDSVSGKCDERGYCVPEGCGNGKIDMGEGCDNSAPMKTAGCRADCTQGCVNDEQCNDKNRCNGDETCDKAHGECNAGTPLSCDDGDACTDDRECLPASGCAPKLIDADGDGVSEQTCKPGSPHKGGDCNGSDSSTYPGAVEYCDGISNDCDGEVDEGAVKATCYFDRDGDGYPTRESVVACTCPPNTRVARADGQFDCWDDPATAGADVHPGQSSVFGTPYPAVCANGSATCPSFDYDCNGQIFRQFPDGKASCGLLSLGILTCSGNDGYVGDAPACGVTARYATCSGGVSCSQTFRQQTQLCR